MNDTVYMLKYPLPDEGIELRYSLRSLKNLPHDRVFMVTPKLPDWIRPSSVVHMGHLPVNTTKYVDLSEKWRWLGTNSHLTDEITYMDDD